MLATTLKFTSIDRHGDTSKNAISSEEEMRRREAWEKGWGEEEGRGEEDERGRRGGGGDGDERNAAWPRSVIAPILTAPQPCGLRRFGVWPSSRTEGEGILLRASHK